MPRPYVSEVMGSAVVTSLPTGVPDGTEVYYRFAQSVIPADAQVLIWHLYYDAPTTAWLPIGRQEPVYAHRGLNESTSFNAQAWGNVSVNDPQVTVPRAGDYDAEWGCGIALIGGVNSSILGLQVAGVDPAPPTVSLAGVDAPSISYAQTNATWDTSGPGHRKLLGLSTGAAVKHRYMTGVAGQLYRGNAYLKLHPRRLT